MSSEKKMKPQGVSIPLVLKPTKSEALSKSRSLLSKKSSFDSTDEEAEDEAGRGLNQPQPLSQLIFTPQKHPHLNLTTSQLKKRKLSRPSVEL